MEKFHDDESEDEDIASFGRPVEQDAFSFVPGNAMNFVNSEKKLEQDVKIQNCHDDKIKTVLARETEAKRHEFVPSGVARALAKGRIAVAMTQRQLAARLNIDKNHVAAIESGTAVYDAQEIRRIRLFLGLPKFES